MQFQMDSQSRRSRSWVGFITNIDSRGWWRNPDEVFAHHSRKARMRVNAAMHTSELRQWVSEEPSFFATFIRGIFLEQLRSI